MCSEKPTQNVRLRTDRFSLSVVSVTFLLFCINILSSVHNYYSIRSSMSFGCFFYCNYQRIQTGQWAGQLQKRVLQTKHKSCPVNSPTHIIKARTFNISEDEARLSTSTSKHRSKKSWNTADNLSLSLISGLPLVAIR